MLDDHSREMSCLQNKSINWFLLQRRKVINAYSQVFDFNMPHWADKNRSWFRKSTMYEQDRTFHLSQYQRNTGSQILVLEYQI